MTALCASGGTSSPKAGVADNLVLSGAALSIFSVIPGLEWLQAIGAGLGVFQYYLPTFCATDPPAMPSFTVNEVLAGLTNQFATSDYASFIAKTTDVIERLVWYQYCKCDAGAQPAAPTAPSQPSGFTWDPGVGVGPAGPCGGSDYAANFQTPSTSYVDSPLLTASGSIPNVYWGPWPGHTDQRIQNVTTLELITRRTQVSTGPHESITWFLHWQTLSTFLYNQVFTAYPADGVDHVERVAIPPGATNVILQYFTAHTSTDVIRWRINLYCNTLPGELPVREICCPTPPDLTVQVRQLTELVTLIQRQAAPFGYNVKATHTGISGSGELTVADLIGLAVDITTTPSRLGVLFGDPNVLWDAGRISVGTADGWTHETWIRADPYLWFPPAMGTITKIGYTIPADVTVTIKELEREP